MIACPALYVITDDKPSRSSDDLIASVCDAITGGATLIQFRERSLPPDDLPRLICSLSAACRAAGVPLLLNGGVCEKLREPVQADGIHLQAHNLDRVDELSGNIITTPGHQLMLGYSAHSVEELVEALQKVPLDFATLSPIYATPSKEGIIAPTGPHILTDCRNTLPEFPVLALGGIDQSRASECIAAGASGIAVMRAVMSAQSPRLAARELIESMRITH
ncbi:hypothetical protein CVU37_03480 [candidate division BRC1 bacterium HGW-BRC1-1]|jgi:thiamine-phosphate pyrophosphorylase|nr:MAG: hypothetical protein CVU37_03480 [candidate division BRC1 bacterium HGW-BRC1-1]